MTIIAIFYVYGILILPRDKDILRRALAGITRHGLAGICQRRRLVNWIARHIGMA